MTLGIAAYFDLVKKTVPGIVLYPLIICGFVNIILDMAMNTGMPAYIPLIISGLIIVVGFILTHFKILGGADVLLFLGIFMLMPVEFSTIPFYYMFIICTLLCGTLYIMLMWLTKKLDSPYIKFVPAILVGFLLALYSVYGNEILGMIF